jgi:uncharacterized membrane protein YraQ (UPF0718 family)
MSHEVGSAFWGIVFAAANICIAIITFRIALTQNDMNVFMRFVFGSMAGRMVITLFAVWYALRVWHLTALPFVLTLLFCYIAAMSGEIIFLHRKQLVISRELYAAKQVPTRSQGDTVHRDGETRNIASNTEQQLDNTIQ